MLVRGEDGDAEVLRSDLEANASADVSVDSNVSPSTKGEEEIIEDGCPTLTVLRDEAEHAISDILNFEEPQVSDALPSGKVIPFVQYGGHNLYKSTIVSQLNANPFL